MPSLTGQEATAAGTALVQQGFDYEQVGEGAEVVAQFPAAGTKVMPGSTIVLYTQEGAEMTVVMPNVTGMSGKAAQAALKAAKLNMLASGADYNDAVMCAVYQSVAEGTEVPAGTVVEVQFGNPNLTE